MPPVVEQPLDVAGDRRKRVDVYPSRPASSATTIILPSFTGRTASGGKLKRLALDDQHRGHLDLDGRRH